MKRRSRTRSRTRSKGRRLEALAAAFGFDGGEVQQLHQETEQLLRKQTRIKHGLTATGLVHRSLRITQEQVEASIKRNLGAVVAEVRETGDLMALLAKSTRESLTSEESARMRAQLVDICRTVPALAVFAAPGGGGHVAYSGPRVALLAVPFVISAPR